MLLRVNRAPLLLRTFGVSASGAVKLAPRVAATRSADLGDKAARPATANLRLVHSDLVVLDELEYLPFSASGGALLFPFAEQPLRAHQPHHHH